MMRGREYLFAAECEQLLGQGSSPISGLLHLI